jgi:hypothetical protein
MAIRHMVLFKFSDDATDSQIDALAAGLDTMPAAVGKVLRYEHGRDVGVNPPSWSYGLVAEFASVDDYLSYRDHPAHQALIRDLVEPITVDRAGVQVEI